MSSWTPLFIWGGARACQAGTPHASGRASTRERGLRGSWHAHASRNTRSRSNPAGPTRLYYNGGFAASSSAQRCQLQPESFLTFCLCLEIWVKIGLSGILRSLQFQVRFFLPKWNPFSTPEEKVLRRKSVSSENKSAFKFFLLKSCGL